jgi:hypothetical protein
MQHAWLPWRDHHEDLSLPRLIKVANLFRAVWSRVSELHEPDEGDGVWSMSCRAFQRCGHKLTLAQQDWPWLSIAQEKAMRWTIGVGNMPVRFYHGDSQEVPHRYSEAADTEKIMRQALLNLDDRIREGVLLRFVTETDVRGVPLTVKLIEYEEKSDSVINTFAIPEAAEGGTVVEFPAAQPKPGIAPPKPSVRPITGRVKGQTDDADPKP